MRKFTCRPLYRVIRVLEDLIAQDGPQDADGFTCGGDARYACGLGDLQVFAVAGQHRLMQDQRRRGAHQRAAEIDIAGLEDVIALAFALAIAGIVAATDEAGAAEDLAGSV